MGRVLFCRAARPACLALILPRISQTVPHPPYIVQTAAMEEEESMEASGVEGVRMRKLREVLERAVESSLRQVSVVALAQCYPQYAAQHKEAMEQARVMITDNLRRAIKVCVDVRAPSVVCH